MHPRRQGSVHYAPLLGQHLSSSTDRPPEITPRTSKSTLPMLKHVSNSNDLIRRSCSARQAIRGVHTVWLDGLWLRTRGNCAKTRCSNTADRTSNLRYFCTVRLSTQLQKGNRARSNKPQLCMTKTSMTNIAILAEIFFSYTQESASTGD